MIVNRSMPQATVIPVLAYPDVAAACDWLLAAFGFTLRWRVGGHRAQINAGDGCIVVVQGDDPPLAHSVMVRVADVDLHYTQASAYGAHILSAPANHPYGERQYGAADLVGRAWTFSESIADIEPSTWGAEVGEL